VMLGGVAQPG